MSTETGAGAPAATAAPAAPADTSELSIHEAKAMLDAMPNGAEFTSAESAEPATAEPELPVEGKSDPETPDPAEPTEEADPDTNPPIEPPRSWTKAEKERFASLPRETQEYLHTREQERDRDFRTRQNEIAEQQKAIKADREAAEKARQQYERQLPALMQELQNVNQANFADVKTMDDVVKLQSEDPFRFQAWQVHQMRLQAAKAESDRVQAEQTQSKQSKRATYEAEQNKLLVDLVPEMADPKKASELRERAVNMLKDDLGLKDDQLSRWISDDTGHEILSNAGIQKLIADGLKYRDILNAPKAIAAKPVPPVQKPGVPRTAGAADSELIQNLEKRLTNSGSEKDAWALYEAKLKASARRSS